VQAGAAKRLGKRLASGTDGSVMGEGSHRTCNSPGVGERGPGAGDRTVATGVLTIASGRGLDSTSSVCT